MRTGRDLYEAHSDDDGQTWSRPVPVHFPGIDIYDTAKWERLLWTPPRLVTCPVTACWAPRSTPI